jgi:hypothetical protein
VGAEAGVSETDISRSIRRTLTAAGFHVERINAGKVRVRGGWFEGASAGTPDTVIVAPARAYGWLETKTEETDLNPNQRKWHAEAKRRGVRVAVVRTDWAALKTAQQWERE